MVLVNNAGILSNNKSQSTTPAEWRKVMSVNLDGSFFMARELLPGIVACCLSCTRVRDMDMYLFGHVNSSFFIACLDGVS